MASKAQTRRLPLSETTLREFPFQLLPNVVHPTERLEKALAWQEQFAEDLEQRPAFEVVLVLSDYNPAFLRCALESLAVQSYDTFALTVICADARYDSASVQRVLEELQLSATVQRCESGLVAVVAEIAASSDATAFVLMSETTLMHPQALFAIAKACRAEVPSLIYTNELRLSGEPKRADHYLRRAPLDRYSLLSRNTLGEFLVVSREFARGVFDRDECRATTFSGLCWWLGTHVVANVEDATFIPLSLAHRQVRDGNGTQSLPDAEVVVSDYAAHLGVALERVENREDDWECVVRPVLAPAEGRVQVIIPFRDQSALTLACVKSLLTQSCFTDLELTLVNNNSKPEELEIVQHGLSDLGVADAASIITVDSYFNFARLNNRGAEQSTSPYILLLNNDVELLDPGTIDELRRWSALPDVGVVGGQLFYDDGSVQHAGINFASVRPFNVRGREHYAHVVRETNGATFAMALIKRQAFDDIKGLDEFYCPNGFGDALFCNELKKSGWRTLYSPYALGVHHESKSRGQMPEELELLEMVDHGLPIADLFADFYAEAQPTRLPLSAMSNAPLVRFAKRVVVSPRLNRIAMRVMHSRLARRVVGR